MKKWVTSSSSISVRSEHPRGAYAARRLREYAGRFLNELRQRGELSVILTSDRAIQTLNRTWRSKDKPTDVLSFPQDPSFHLLGDVVISLDTARRQAREGSRTLTDELARLLAHGLLHLLGHDHEKPEDARRMARAEVKLLGTVGLVGEALDHPAQLTFHRAPVSNAPRRAPLRTRARRKSGRASETRS